MAEQKLNAKLGLDTKEFDRKLKESKGKVESAGKGVSGAAAGIATAIAAVGGAFAILKNAIAATATGLDQFNIIAKVTKQIMYDILQRTSWRDMRKNIEQVVYAQGVLNFVRRKEREDLYQSKLSYANYQKFLVESHDQMLTGAERIKAYDYALTSLNMSIKEQQGALLASLGAYQKLLKAAPDNEEYLIEEARLKNALIDLEVRRFSGTKEISSMRSGLIKSERDRLLELEKAFNAVTRAETEMLYKLPPKSVFEAPKIKSLAPELPGIQGYSGTNDAEKALEMARKWDEFMSTNPFGEAESGLSETQSALINLAGTFASFFSDVNLGFQSMIDGVIAGIKRLVMEIIAKAVFLTILSALFPGAGVALNLGTILGGNAAKLIGSGTASSGTSGVVGSSGGESLVAHLRGKDVDIILKRM